MYEQAKLKNSLKIKEMIEELLEMNSAVLDRFMVHQTSNLLNNKYDSASFAKLVQELPKKEDVYRDIEMQI